MESSSSQEEKEFVNGDLRIDYVSGCVYLKGKELHMTSTEYKLLTLLAKNFGKVLTHTYITKEVWGSAWDNDVASLRVFMATLRKKIEEGITAEIYPDTCRDWISDAAGSTVSFWEKKKDYHIR